jgi:hypothetical protein
MSEQTRYPLCWPEGWPRTPSHNRKRAAFHKSSMVSSTNSDYSYRQKSSLTISDATNRVLDELRRLGAHGDVIISSNLRLRNDGLPMGKQAQPDDPGVAVYWEKRGKPQNVMAIDLYDKVEGNLAAIAATLDAMRAIERHGGAQILERAFTGFQALPSPEQAGGLPWHVVLEIDTQYSYTIDDCENQYRRLRSQCHPDKPGGSSEKFQQLQRAIEQARRELKK